MEGSRDTRDGRTRRRVLFAMAGAAIFGACGGGSISLPSPRPLVVYSGARLQADSAKMQEVHGWVLQLVDAVNADPSFMLVYESVPEAAYPWETMELRGRDTVRIAYEAAAEDVRTTYWVYGFLHLMKHMDRMDEWFPEAAELEGYALERFILDRTADSWLMGRAVFGIQPYGLLDEVVYAQDRGYLDEFLLTARGEEFPEAREDFERANPDRMEEYASWFRETFDRDPPGSDSR